MSDVEPRDVADEVLEPVVDEPTGDPRAGTPGADAPVEDTIVDEPAISDALLGRAKDYGLSASDLEGFDDTRLERMFSTIDRRLMQPQSPTGPAAAAGPVPVAPGMGEYTPLKVEFGDELDESLITPINTVVEHLNGQLKEVHAFRQQAQSELRAMNVLREFSEFDRFVSGLGEDWAPEYGSGVTVEMDPASSEFQKRLDVFNGAKSLRADAHRRRQRMSMSNALTRSHRATHWDRVAEHERKKLDGKIERRRKGSAERPVKGKQPAMSPRDEAIEAWK